ncbi:hypothetical protein FGIG_00097 [Fasciola gigantica]|uniref:Uncharacterized protein n=1 Tax=Fasciola gigantica TaxID=46835 RepID=A0A504YD20_FASGI|nr:hypothetical protein FGIG_00097 [Fasciola gigantica]
MRHMVFNPLKREATFLDKYFLVALMFIGSIISVITHLYRPALVLYSGSNAKIKHDRVHLHMTSHTLLIGGLRLCAILLASKWDDDDYCMQLGPLQISLNWTAESVNMLQIVALFIVTRSHRPLGLMFRLVCSFYCAGIIAGCVIYLAFPYDYLQIQLVH